MTEIEQETETKLRHVVTEIVCFALKASGVTLLALMVLAWWIITP